MRLPSLGVSPGLELIFCSICPVPSFIPCVHYLPRAARAPSPRSSESALPVPAMCFVVVVNPSVDITSNSYGSRKSEQFLKAPLFYALKERDVPVDRPCPPCIYILARPHSDKIWVFFKPELTMRLRSKWREHTGHTGRGPCRSPGPRCRS